MSRATRARKAVLDVLAGVQPPACVSWRDVLDRMGKDVLPHATSAGSCGGCGGCGGCGPPAGKPQADEEVQP